MRQFKELRLRALPAQGFDDPETDATAAVHGDALRFVDDQHGLVFIDNRQIDALLGNLIDFILRPLGDPERRYAQAIAGTQAVGRINPPAINTHLAASQNPVDVAFGHTLATPDQEIVETLAMFLVADHRMGD